MRYNPPLSHQNDPLFLSKSLESWVRTALCKNSPSRLPHLSLTMVVDRWRRCLPLPGERTPSDPNRCRCGLDVPIDDISGPNRRSLLALSPPDAPDIRSGRSTSKKVESSGAERGWVIELPQNRIRMPKSTWPSHAHSAGPCRCSSVGGAHGPMSTPSTRQLARSTRGLVPRPGTPWFARQHAEPGAIMRADP